MPKSKCKKNAYELLLKTNAIQESINVISTFALRFSAAVRGSPAEQPALVGRILETLTTPFSVSIILNGVTYTVTNYAEFLQLIQEFSAGAIFDSSLTSNFSVEEYRRDCNGRQFVQIQSLEYVVQTQPSGQSILIPALDQYSVQQTGSDVFKISKLVATALTEIPLGTTGVAALKAAAQTKTLPKK